MNFCYRLTEKDGNKHWEQVTYQENTDSFQKLPLNGSLVLDPADFSPGAEVIVNFPSPSKGSLSLEELVNLLEKQLPSIEKQIKPYLYHCSEACGQDLEVLLSSEAYLGKWINKHLTIYYSVESPEKIVGFRIENLMGLILRGCY